MEAPEQLPAPPQVPRFTVDLDLPPRKRWRHIIEAYIPEVKELVKFIQKTERDEFGALGPWFAYMMRSTFSAAWQLMLPPELSEELEGIADLTAEHGLDYRNLLLLNIGYDLVARCTSLVVEDGEGRPHLLRNMDWEAPVFHQTTIQVDFCRKGRPLFAGTTWIGYVGLLTGMRYPGGGTGTATGGGGYAVSLNFRQLDPSLFGYLGPLWGIARRRWPAAALIRHTLGSVDSYPEALAALRTTLLIAPCYFTLAGAKRGEGSIITRNPTADENHLHAESRGPIVQTNIDHWVDNADEQWAAGDPLLLNAVERRQCAYQLLASLPAGSFSPDLHGFVLLEQPPVRNELTIYSCVICPARADYRTRLQFPPGHPRSHHTGRVHQLFDLLQSPLHPPKPGHHHGYSVAAQQSAPQEHKN